MVDEVQDLSGDDWKLLHALSEKHGNLFVVGDPDQAIYEWRGGNPKIFVDFKAHTDIILNENYRSTPDVLDVANFIIANNSNRVKKELFTLRLNERLPIYYHAKSEKEEARMIADTIAEGIRNGASYNDFAVLYRSSFLSRTVEQALLKKKIPYSVWGGVRFFERKEIKDVISYLRLVASDADDLAFRRIINLPSRKFGDASMKALDDIAREEGLPLMVALRQNIMEKPFCRPAIANFINLIDMARERCASMSISDLTDWLMTESRLADLYRTDEKEERLENITELLNAMKDFEASKMDDGDTGLESYLQEIALYVNADREEHSERIKLMTIHQSKGLEFDTVFITGLTEGVFPNHRSIRERRKDGEEEERRLMYVAVTRARNMLYLMESEGYLNDNGALKYPSRFISEVPDSYLEIIGNPDPSLREGTRNLVSLLNSEVYESDDAPWAAGSRVSHKVFGEGTIEFYDASSKAYRVKFGEKIRMLVPRVLSLVAKV